MIINGFSLSTQDLW